MFWEVIGVLALIFGIIYPIPQVQRVYKNKKVVGISRYFLFIWIADKLLSFIYAAHLGNPVFMVKYGVGVLLVFVIIYYRFFPKDKTDEVTK